LQYQLDHQKKQSNESPNAPTEYLQHGMIVSEEMPDEDNMEIELDYGMYHM
jgi:hypothetical protein